MVVKAKKQVGWDKLIAEYKEVRELTKEQIKDIKSYSLEQAKQGLSLRKDLLEVVKNLDKKGDGWNTMEYQWLKRYLVKKYANLEYELFNNGLGNLISKLESLWEKTENDELEQVIRNFNDKKYGDCGTSSFGDCLKCGQFGELNNGWGKNEGYHYECQENTNQDYEYTHDN